MAKKKHSIAWPTTASEHGHMKMRQDQNRLRALNNPNENQVTALLKATGYKWTRQAQWGCRLFDFWNARLGIAVEVDGPEHNQDYERFRDRCNYETSGILVLRVRNQNLEDVERALIKIKESETWNERRTRMNLKPKTG